MPKRERDVIFEMLLDNLTNGVVFEVFNDSFNIFPVYLTIMFIPLK